MMLCSGKLKTQSQSGDEEDAVNSADTCPALVDHAMHPQWAGWGGKMSITQLKK